MIAGPPLRLGADRAMRQRLFTKASFAHPAKLHLGFLAYLVEQHTRPGQTILDPMVGIGSTCCAALLDRHVIGYDVEARWLAEAHRNAARILEAAGMFAGRITLGQHDATQPWPARADVVLFSPPYACRTSPNAASRASSFERRRALLDQHRLSDRWRELVDRAEAQPGAMGAELFHYGAAPFQIGHLRGPRYWDAMTAVYHNARAALPAGGLMILVVKDHIRDGRRVTVCDDTARRCEGLGFRLVARHRRHLEYLSFWQRRRREQGLPVVEDEEALVLEAI